MLCFELFYHQMIYIFFRENHFCQCCFTTLPWPRDSDNRKLSRQSQQCLFCNPFYFHAVKSKVLFCKIQSQRHVKSKVLYVNYSITQTIYTKIFSFPRPFISSLSSPYILPATPYFCPSYPTLPFRQDRKLPH